LAACVHIVDKTQRVRLEKTLPTIKLVIVVALRFRSHKFFSFLINICVHLVKIFPQKQQQSNDTAMGADKADFFRELLRFLFKHYLFCIVLLIYLFIYNTTRYTGQFNIVIRN